MLLKMGHSKLVPLKKFLLCQIFSFLEMPVVLGFTPFFFFRINLSTIFSSKFMDEVYIIFIGFS